MTGQTIKRTSYAQERAICKIVELMSKHAAQEPQTLFVMGSYRIGKERAYLGAAKALGYRCHVNADKLRVSHSPHAASSCVACHRCPRLVRSHSSYGTVTPPQLSCRLSDMVKSDDGETIIKCHPSIGA